MTGSRRPDHTSFDPASERLDLVFLGLSITSSWGNGHATNYRALVRALEERGHDVLFLERDVPWYAQNRDLPEPPWGSLHLYDSVDEVRDRFGPRIASADAVVVGSFVPDGVHLGHWVNDVARGTTIFYDIDTPVTLGKLEDGDREYLEPELVPRYDLYLSFAEGPVLDVLEDEYGSPAARPFHCLVDPQRYRPSDQRRRWALGYLGTYSEDRQPGLDRLLVEPARRAPDLRFCVAGSSYPGSIEWPENVERRDHVPPSDHRRFYTGQRFTLNVTRERMIRAGWSPGVRLFEAAACGVPVISDAWEGLDRFFVPDREIFLADGPEEVLRILVDTSPEDATRMGARARERVLQEHTAEHRAVELEGHLRDERRRRDPRDRPGGPEGMEAVAGPFPVGGDETEELSSTTTP